MTKEHSVNLTALTHQNKNSLTLLDANR